MAWYQERPQRYKVELDTLKKYYPQAKIRWDNYRLVIYCQFYTRHNRYMVKIIYPDGFPYDHPCAYIASPLIRESPHRYSDEALSIHFNSDGPQISGKIMLDGAKKWICAYEKWRKTGIWPEGAVKWI